VVYLTFTFCIFWQASENLGMAMIYTLVTSSKEWLSERFGQESSLEIAEAEERAKEDVRISICVIIFFFSVKDSLCPSIPLVIDSFTFGLEV